MSQEPCASRATDFETAADDAAEAVAELPADFSVDGFVQRGGEMFVDGRGTAAASPFASAAKIVTVEVCYNAKKAKQVLRLFGSDAAAGLGGTSHLSTPWALLHLRHPCCCCSRYAPPLYGTSPSRAHPLRSR